MSFEGGNSGKSTDTDAWMNFSVCNESEEKKKERREPMTACGNRQKWLQIFPVQPRESCASRASLLTRPDCLFNRIVSKVVPHADEAIP